MVYLKALLFGCIGLVVAFVLRIIWRIAATAWHSRASPDLIVVLDSQALLDKIFMLLAGACVGVGGVPR